MENRDTLPSVQPIAPEEYVALLISRRHLELVRPHRVEELAMRGALRDCDTGTLYVPRVLPRSAHAEVSASRDERR
jgi:hypothetical protein